jgi:hypothetical protein
LKCFHKLPLASASGQRKKKQGFSQTGKNNKNSTKPLAEASGNL